MSKSVSSALLGALAAHLKTMVPALQSVSEGFPAPNQALKYPCATISIASAKFLNGLPYVNTKTIVPTDPPGGVSKYRTRWVIGIYEFKIQVDIWCGNKFDRQEIQESIFKALNPNTATMGLSLQIADYFNEWARISVSTFDLPDAERGSQSNEWRIRYDLIADSKAISESLENTMQTIENNIETPSTTISGPSTEQAADEVV